MITSINQLDLKKRYTYQDYLSWQFEEMVELIKGKIVRMSPAPTPKHQIISGNLHGFIWNYLRGKKCQVFSAPFDVVLTGGIDKVSGQQIDTVVQPDLSVICDLSKVDGRGCKGAPDWIIEILSPATSKKDLTVKFDLYQKAGVTAYWVVYPTEELITTYRLNDKGLYEASRVKPFVVGERITVDVFPDLVIELEEIFTF